MKEIVRWDFIIATGFRCGICYEFPVFHVIKRIKMNLIEEPLSFMENPFLLKNLQNHI